MATNKIRRRTESIHGQGLTGEDEKMCNGEGGGWRIGGKYMVCGILLVVMNYVREELKSVFGIYIHTFNLHLNLHSIYI